MARIVMKFGGTSMAGSERIRRVAGIVRRQQAAGHEVAVVVSAMAGETDRLVGFCREADALYDALEALYRDDPDGAEIRELIRKDRTP